MAYENLTGSDIFTRPANADLSAKQYYGVKISTTNAALCDTAGEAHLGVLLNKPAASGRAAEIARDGIAKVFAGGTIAAGDLLTMDASGKYVVGYGSDLACAKALSAASASDVVEAIILPGTEYCQHGPQTWTTHLNLADIANGDLLTNFNLASFVRGGRIKAFRAAVTKAATTGAKLSTLNLEIGTTNLTGGSLALTSANMTPLGAVVEASAITAANTFTSASNFSIEAASTTAFVEGEIDLIIDFA